MPSTTRIVSMTPQEAGIWQFYCVVFDHIQAGMMGRLIVQ